MNAFRFLILSTCLFAALQAADNDNHVEPIEVLLKTVECALQARDAETLAGVLRLVIAQNKTASEAAFHFNQVMKMASSHLPWQNRIIADDLTEPDLVDDEVTAVALIEGGFDEMYYALAYFFVKTLEKFEDHLKGSKKCVLTMAQNFCEAVKPDCWLTKGIRALVFLAAATVRPALASTALGHVRVACEAMDEAAVADKDSCEEYRFLMDELCWFLGHFPSQELNAAEKTVQQELLVYFA